MKLSKKAAVFTAAAAVSAGLAVSLAGAAGATSRTPAQGGGTHNCADGIYAGDCGTLESGTGLYIAVGAHGRVIGTTHPRPSNAEFFWFSDESSSAANNDKYAEFAPNGVASNMVMAEVRHHEVELVTASGAPNQKWVSVGTGWQNVATGDVLVATSNGGPVFAVTGPSSGPSETWTFVAP